jgi:hypothetical protein
MIRMYRQEAGIGSELGGFEAMEIQPWYVQMDGARVSTGYFGY